MERIPILKMGRVLLVTIQVDMHDRLALALQDDLTERIVKDGARGVLIDISSLEIVDSFIGRVLGDIALYPHERAFYPDLTVEEGIRIFLTGGMSLPAKIQKQ